MRAIAGISLVLATGSVLPLRLLLCISLVLFPVSSASGFRGLPKAPNEKQDPKCRRTHLSGLNLGRSLPPTKENPSAKGKPSQVGVSLPRPAFTAALAGTQPAVQLEATRVLAKIRKNAHNAQALQMALTGAGQPIKRRRLKGSRALSMEQRQGRGNLSLDVGCRRSPPCGPVLPELAQGDVRLTDVPDLP